MDKISKKFSELDLADDDFCYFAAQSLSLQQKFGNKIFLEDCAIKEVRVRDKREKSTVENVLDPRTKIILFKMLNRGIFCEVQGCISTGKEANVYFAPRQSDADAAIKIYKTSILSFKDRDKYISGDFRFKNGYCRKNPRKMVESWAEKEFRNLTRMYREGLPCPQPLILRQHILVMSFVGTEGSPAPLLKDVHLTKSAYSNLYLDCCKVMRNMYRKCNLIHADLSEYNVLYHMNNIVFIDVSQSVEPDHPYAMVFLRNDCVHVTDFFKKHDVDVMTVEQLLRYITCGATDDVLAFMEAAREDAIEGSVVEDIFIQPLWRLDDVINPEREIFENKDHPVLLVMNSSDEGDSRSKHTVEKIKEPLKCRRNESPHSRKERKSLVKEANKQKRLTKVKKHIKKQKCKQSK